MNIASPWLLVVRSYVLLLKFTVIISLFSGFWYWSCSVIVRFCVSVLVMFMLGAFIVVFSVVFGITFMVFVLFDALYSSVSWNVEVMLYVPMFRLFSGICTSPFVLVVKLYVLLLKFTVIVWLG